MLKLFSILGLALMLTACQSYLDGSSRTIGEVTDDSAILAGVKTALISDEEIKGLAINVEVSRSVVSLYGRIPSDSMRKKALALAGEVRGVRKVEDRLTLVTSE